MRALIIEDEWSAREDLRALLEAHPDIAIVGEAATMATARDLLQRADYGLVFLDVQLLGGTSFDLIDAVWPNARVIFTTAHDRFAVRAFEFNALDYLLKPIRPARLAAALQRVTPTAEVEINQAGPGAIPLRPDDIVHLITSSRALFAPIANVSLITAQDNYTEVTLCTGERLLIRKSLSIWQAVLPTPQFVRAHRSCIVNLARLVRYERDPDENSRLYLTGVPAPVPASRRTWAELRAQLTLLRPNF